jgi:hypothetical protein
MPRLRLSFSTPITGIPTSKRKCNRRISFEFYQDLEEGDALPISFIESIYDYVCTHEIQLLCSVTMSEDFRSPEQKSQEFYKKSLENIRDAQKRMRSAATALRWVAPAKPETIRPMFESVWMPLNALASKILTQESPPEIVSNVLIILTSSISIAARFFMETESIVCMSTLATFTRLQPWAPIEVQTLRVIRELLEMSKTFSSYFEPVWGKILMLFTQLNSLILAHNTSMPGEHTVPEIVRANAELVSQYVPQIAIDELFDRSSTFEPPALVSFVTALCKVSNRELGQHPPSTFCLQKIIEVTDANMGRDRGMVHVAPHLETCQSAFSGSRVFPARWDRQICTRFAPAISK